MAGFILLFHFNKYPILSFNQTQFSIAQHFKGNDISNCLRVFNDGSFQVAYHKTSESGPAVFGLSADVYHQITRYVPMLDLVPGNTSDCNRTKFINWPNSNGVVTDMTSSHVKKSLQRFWGRGTTGSKKLTVTRLRKATSTTVRKR